MDDAYQEARRVTIARNQHGKVAVGRPAGVFDVSGWSAPVSCFKGVAL